MVFPKHELEMKSSIRVLYGEELECEDYDTCSMNQYSSTRPLEEVIDKATMDDVEIR